MTAREENWQPPYTLGEKLKYTLVPAALYIRYRAIKEYRRGEPEIRLLRYLVDPRRNSVDVGANKGVYTYYLARHSKRVFAFEPNSKMFRLLMRHAGANVTVSPLALSNRSGAAVLLLRENPRHRGRYTNQGGTFSPVKVQAAKIPSNYRDLKVETARLDDLEITDVGFIKIDVEGFEWEVLEGARGTIARDRPVLLVEMEERYLNICIEEAIGRVESLGYRGLALAKGSLIDLARFDGDRHHRSLATRADYINNFIFLPLSGLSEGFGLAAPSGR